MRALFWKLLKPLVFRLNAETAHDLVMAFLKFGIKTRNIPLRLLSGAKPLSSEGVEVWGIRFMSPVGLAAGFDKDAEVFEGIPALGFGFVEIGTVTPRPQPGNPKPRLFRDPQREALFNRMGFNGQGAKAAAERLARSRGRLPDGFRVGINIGKNKDTPLESAHLDYGLAIEPFDGLVDYIVINVSSPNTPGLRTLQNVDSLKLILESTRRKIEKWTRRPPLLLKLAPEVEGEALEGLLRSLEATGGVDGWVLTNTLGGVCQSSVGELSGGWSGGPLTSIARRSLQEARRVTRLPIVSVGGIMSVEEAKARIVAGASLVQLYSSWIFRGPSFPVDVTKYLSK